MIWETAKLRQQLTICGRITGHRSWNFPEDALPVTMASYLAPWHQRHFGMDVKSNAEDLDLSR